MDPHSHEKPRCGQPACRRILLFERAVELGPRIERLFARDEVQVVRETSGAHVLRRAAGEAFDLLLLTDAALAATNGERRAFDELLAGRSAGMRALVLDTAPAAEPAPAGVCDRTSLPASDRELQLLIEDALEGRLPGEEGRGRLGELIGASAAMQAVYRQIRLVARTEIPVLILGETGTGKELATAVIHALSSRRDGACIAVNLGALPTELVASELFGHEKGSFTGAAERRLGKFELARGGTILLDEIDSIDAKVQVSLLRLLEQKEFHRLGGREAIRSDARLITATNRDLARLAAEGLFREDLFYRLETFCITMPPLRERSGDVRLLSEAFLERAAAELGRGVTEIAGDALAILESYAWPGNVRELRNVIRRAVLLCAGRRILPRHLPERVRPADRHPSSGIPFPIGMPLHEVERDMIRRVLASTMNNRTRAAALLGITRRSLYSKLNKHGIGACEHAAQGA